VTIGFLRSGLARRPALWTAVLLLLPAIAAVVACTHPRPASVSDAAIVARVKTVLLNDTQIDATTIDVQASGGRVTLSGTARNQAERDRAVALTRGVDGVSSVVDRITIPPA